MTPIKPNSIWFNYKYPCRTDQQGQPGTFRFRSKLGKQLLLPWGRWWAPAEKLQCTLAIWSPSDLQRSTGNRGAQLPCISTPSQLASLLYHSLAVSLLCHRPSTQTSVARGHWKVHGDDGSSSTRFGCRCSDRVGVGSVRCCSNTVQGSNSQRPQQGSGMERRGSHRQHTKGEPMDLSND